MANPTIIIDAGHGGYDNGASDNGRLEKDDNLRLALAVGEILTADGFPVVYTRTEDVYQRPIDKAGIANESGGDYFVSFHRNASPERNTYSGVQTLVYSDEGIKAELARRINEELGKLGDIKTARLLIYERRLCEHRVGTLLHDVLKLLVGNGKTELLALIVDNLLVDVGIPHLILDLVEFLLREVVTTLSHLHNLLILVNECLEFLYVYFVS